MFLLTFWQPRDERKGIRKALSGRPSSNSVPIHRSVTLERSLVSIVSYHCRVVVIFEVRNFLAPNPGICEVPGENPLGKIIYESVHI